MVAERLTATTPRGPTTEPATRSNPFTCEPYPPNVVNYADYARVVAEFWADGPDSETPPGHWNTLANYLTDHPALGEKRLGGPDGPAARRPGVGRQALPRTQRRRARRGDRRLGLEALLRLLAADHADPLHGPTGPVVRSVAAALPPAGPAARPRPDRADHTRDDRSRRAARAPLGLLRRRLQRRPAVRGRGRLSRRRPLRRPVHQRDRRDRDSRLAR